MEYTKLELEIKEQSEKAFLKVSKVVSKFIKLKKDRQDFFDNLNDYIDAEIELSKLWD